MISDYYRYLSVRNHISDLLNGKKEFDICNIYEGRVGGVGYNELRYCSFDENGQLTFESNNVHDYECGEDCYKIFTWEELTDYEKEMLYYVFSCEQKSDYCQNK